VSSITSYSSVLIRTCSRSLVNLKDEFTQTPELAERKLYEQCLTGDSTDGYAGCPGIGPKRAGLILDKCNGSYWEAVVKAFEDADLTEEDAVRNFNLAHILQVDNWDKVKQQPILK
jgi:5'-3' exonuclease